jgi:hypothetical protein
MNRRQQRGFNIIQRRCERAVWTVAALMLFTVGCGPKPQGDPNRTRVSGTVSFNGQPLKAGMISFDSTESGIGTAVSIRDGGVYTTDRVPIGQNIVTIETESLQFGSPHLYVKIPAKYSDPSKSGITIDVKPGENANVDFNLTK